MTNAPYSAYSNYSGFEETFTRRSMQEIYTNVFDIVTQGNGTWDSEWPTCLGCAAIERSLESIGMQRSEQCNRCFQKYCWNGDFDNAVPGVVDPSMALYPTVSYAEWEKTGKIE
jgi:lysophospholipase